MSPGKDQDTFGLALLDTYKGTRAAELTLEVDDGRVYPAMDPEWFFLPDSQWHQWERQQLEHCQGPVLDLGAGAGRASLYLQSLTSNVVAMDYSPGAAEVCALRGVESVRHGDFLTHIPKEHRWQTVLLLCGNLGLAGGWNETRIFLRQIHKVCQPGAILIGDTVDPTIFADDGSLAYQQVQISRGNYVGDVSLRLNYGSRNGVWWKQTNFRISDIESLVAETGWELAEHHIDEPSHYVKLVAQ